jgi:hypothetical protein
MMKATPYVRVVAALRVVRSEPGLEIGKDRENPDLFDVAFRREEQVSARGVCLQLCMTKACYRPRNARTLT